MTGLMAVSYDIGFVLISFYVSFGLARSHIPRVIASGFLLLGLGSVTFTLPHFLTGDYIYGESPSNMCPAEESCDDYESTNLLGYIALFILGQLMHGIGSTPLYTLGFSYLEESTSGEDGALYFAIVLMGSCLGPAIGFVFGAVQLNVWVDAPQVDPGDGIDPSDPQWVGAWWIGMLACGFGAVMCALPMFGFPKQFPGVAKIKSEKKSESIEKALVDDDVSLGAGIVSLLKNPVFLFAGIGSAMDGYLSSCIMTFGPKIYEIRFHKTAGEAAFQAGVACVPGAVIGSFLGGVIAKVFKLTGRQMMYVSTCSAVIVLIFYTLAMQIACDVSPLAGVTVPYPNGGGLNLTNSCNAECTCTQEYYNPVCAEDMTYFSPCHAGCHDIVYNVDQTEQNYTNCDCANEMSVIAVDGNCMDPEQENCESKSYVFLALVFIVVLFEFLPPTLVPIATLRAVDPKLKGLSMGLQWDILRLFGSIPGPIVLGKLMDNACSVWEYICDDRRSCWIYDDHKMFLAVFVLRKSQTLTDLIVRHFQ